MGTNKEMIESLEAGLGGLQNNFSRMEIGVNNKLHQIEDALSKLFEVLLSNQTASISNNSDPTASSLNGRSRSIREESRDISKGGRPLFSSKLASLEFPYFSRDNPAEWFTRVDQFFEFQSTTESQKVSLASFHLQGEANQWWQWLRRSYKKEGREVTQSTFQEELWARSSPTKCEDFDETLSKVKQEGSLCEY